MTDLNKINIEFVQKQFPGLAADWVFFDNAGGSQVLKSAVDRITEFLYERNVQTGGSYAVSQSAAAGLKAGRTAAQTLVNASRPEEIVFGPSSTVLVQNLAAAMRGLLSPGDEIIISTADHESNIGPWDRLREYGITVKDWTLDHDSYSLRLQDLEPLMSDRTRLVCVHHVSNILGSINPIKEIANFVHERGAQICVDGVAYAPHRAIDVQDWDVDYYILSLYKCYGPHTAVMYGKYDLLSELNGLYHYFYGKDQVPGKLEPGNPNYELAYSAVGIVDYFVALGELQGATGSHRKKLVAAYKAITSHEDALVDRLLTYLNARNDCRVIGVNTNENSSRVPTVAFKLEGQDSGAVARAMDEYGIAIRFGDFHSRRLIQDLREEGDSGVIRVSMLHYNTIEQVDRLTAALTDITYAR